MSVLVVLFVFHVVSDLQKRWLILAKPSAAPQTKGVQMGTLAWMMLWVRGSVIVDSRQTQKLDPNQVHKDIFERVTHVVGLAGETKKCNSEINKL